MHPNYRLFASFYLINGIGIILLDNFWQPNFLIGSVIEMAFPFINHMHSILTLSLFISLYSEDVWLCLLYFRQSNLTRYASLTLMYMSNSILKMSTSLFIRECKYLFFSLLARRYKYPRKRKISNIFVYTWRHLFDINIYF